MNSTFYGQPRAEVTRGWAERTPADFEFSVKLYQKFTHPRMFEERVERSLRRRRGPTPSRVQELAQAQPPPTSTSSGAASSRWPARQARRAARAVSAELQERRPPSARISTTCCARSPTIRSPSNCGTAAGATRSATRSTLLNAFEAAWVQIDEPKFRFSIRQNYLPNVQGFYYMRLHGRNAEQWWRHDKSEDRYNYLYSADELQEFSDTADAARRLVKKAYLYTNNHFSAKSVANAAMIKQQLGEPIEGEYPPEFIERYPQLTGAVKGPAEAGHYCPD